MKENELQYVKKEVQCLREELQMMQKVGVFWEQLEKSRRGKGGKQQGCSRQTFLSPVLLVLADCRAHSSTDWHRLRLHEGRVTET